MNEPVASVIVSAKHVRTKRVDVLRRAILTLKDAAEKSISRLVDETIDKCEPTDDCFVIDADLKISLYLTCDIKMEPADA